MTQQKKITPVEEICCICNGIVRVMSDQTFKFIDNDGKEFVVYCHEACFELYKWEQTQKKG